MYQNEIKFQITKRNEDFSLNVGKIKDTFIVVI